MTTVLKLSLPCSNMTSKEPVLPAMYTERKDRETYCAYREGYRVGIYSTPATLGIYSTPATLGTVAL